MRLSSPFLLANDDASERSVHRHDEGNRARAARRPRGGFQPHEEITRPRSKSRKRKQKNKSPIHSLSPPRAGHPRAPFHSQRTLETTGRTAAREARAADMAEVSFFWEEEVGEENVFSEICEEARPRKRKKKLDDERIFFRRRRLRAQRGFLSLFNTLLLFFFPALLSLGEGAPPIHQAARERVSATASREEQNTRVERGKNKKAPLS